MDDCHHDHQNSTNLQPEEINKVLSPVVILCDILGCLCIALNLFITTVIIKNRKRILKNIFYILVLHCSIVDLLRGCCLILWSLPHTLISNYTATYDRLLILKISQFITMILRSCNLLTIFNLLIFTCNEFTVVHYPLFYRHRFRRRVVLIYLLFSWLVSFTPEIGSMAFFNFFKSSHSVVISCNRNETFYNNNTCEYIVNRRAVVMSINIVTMLVVFTLCYLSLFIVLFCYGSIMRTIRRLRKENLMNEDLVPTVHFKWNVSMLKLIPKRSGSVQSLSNRNNSRTRRHYWRSHRMYKYKHVIVIGTVLFVYILFLLPYSGIQLIAILHITNIISVPSHFALIKWSLQVLTGVHAVCQPICYFRMAEFRHLAYFGGKIKQRNFSSRSPTHSNKPCKT